MAPEHHRSSRTRKNLKESTVLRRGRCLKMEENQMLKLAFFKNNWRNHLWFPEPLVNLSSFFATTKRSAARDGKNQAASLITSGRIIRPLMLLLKLLRFLEI
jgi:hypothetical protein